MDVMKRIFFGVLLFGVLIGGRAVSAQQPPPPPPPQVPATPVPAAPTPAAPKLAPAAPLKTVSPARTDTGVSIVGTGGISAVQNVGLTAGGMLTVRLTDRVDAIGEGFWVQDAASRVRIDAVTAIATYLQTSQGKPASATLTVPGFIAGGGVRLMLAPPGHVRPYIVITAGIARLALRPTFTLAGADVTTSLGQYGVTLGADVTGELTKPAFGGGVGVIVDQGRWYVDAGARMTRIQTEGQPTTVLRAVGGLGVKF
jgi:hypothetical protein